MTLFLSCPSLHAYPGDSTREFWLVYWADEQAATLEGAFDRLDPREVGHSLIHLHFDDFEVERFMALVGQRDSLFEPEPLLHGEMANPHLDRLVEGGTLIALRKRDLGELDPVRRAVRSERDVVREFLQIARLAPVFPGRRCILVSRADYASVPGRENYQVVRHEEASLLFSAAAGAPTVAPSARLVLEKAAKLLAPNWRPPLSPQGLVLLRELPRMVASQRPEAALTPSQIRTLREAETSVNLELVVLGYDDQPLKDIKFSIETPDDDVREGDLGAGGKTSLVSTKKGRATITLSWPESEASA